MALSDTAIIVLGLLLLAAVIAAIIYIIRGTMRRKPASQQRYIWKPEQDYDVVYSDEGPMTPPFPTLKKRQRR